MAVVGHLHKIAFGGQLALTEEWSCSLHFLSPDSLDINSALLNGAVEQWFERATSQINGAAKLDWLKANEISPTTGLYISQTEAHTFFYVPAIVPPTGSFDFPHTTFCVSTTTALLRGHAHGGRFYPPTGTPAADSGGRLAAATTLGMATSAAQLVTDINGAASGECVVFSRVGQVTQEILGVRVGRVLDTQQRRRKNLLEDYQPALVS